MPAADASTLLEFQKGLNREIVAGQQAGISELKASLARAHHRLRRYEQRETLRRPLLAELLRDSMELVVTRTNGKQVTLHSLIEDDDYVEEAAAQIDQILAGEWPRSLCYTCRQSDCTGCKDGDCQQYIPSRIGSIMAALATDGWESDATLLRRCTQDLLRDISDLRSDAAARVLEPGEVARWATTEIMNTLDTYGDVIGEAPSCRS